MKYDDFLNKIQEKAEETKIYYANTVAEFLKNIEYEVGDIVMSKQWNCLYQINEILVKNERHWASEISIPSIAVKMSKMHLNGKPHKSAFEHKLDEIEFHCKNSEFQRIVKTPKPTYVYLIEAGDIYKIGFSNNPEKRLYGIQTSNPHVCKILYKIADPLGTLEKDLHKQFERFRLNGEWFTKNEMIANTFEQLSKDNGTSLRNTLTLFN